MLKHLHRIAGLCFYLLGLSFLLAYLFLRNNLGMPWSAWWLDAGDLPLIASAIVYGGTSLYLSVTKPNGSRFAAFVIGIPLVSLFVLLVVLNNYSAIHCVSAAPDALLMVRATMKR